MPILEFQIKASTFLTMQRNALRNLALCPPTLPPVYGVQMVIDRIEFGNSALRHNKPGNFTILYDEDGELTPTPYQPDGFITQLAQDVTLYLTTMGDILAHPNSDPTLIPITATLVFDLDFYPVDHECYITGKITNIEWGPLPNFPPYFNPLAVLPADTQADIKTFMMQQVNLFTNAGAVPVGLDVLPDEMRFINAGISVDRQMQFIAVRLQAGGGSNMNADVPWGNFFKGYIADRLQGNDFAFFVESLLVTEKIKYEVYKNLPKNDDLETFPDCKYSFQVGKAILTIDVLVIYHIYKNHYLDIDINVQAEPKVDINLSVVHPNEITIDFDFSHLLDSDDPLVGFVVGLLSFFGVPVQEILLTIAGVYILPELKKNISTNCKKLSLTHMQCTRDINLPQIPGALQTTLTTLSTFEDGFALAGVINAKDLTAAVVSTTINEFKITVPSVSCGAASIALVAAFQNDPTAFGVLTARGFIENKGTAPLRLCNAPAVLRGSPGPFPAQNIRTDGSLAPFNILINIAAPDINYYNNPYPLELLVKTSGGTRLLRFAPPPTITGEDYQGLTAVLLVKIGNCQMLLDSWARLHSGYNPRWSPRPPEGDIVQHKWEVIINGLRAGDAVALVDSQNRQIASAVSTGAPVRVMSIVAPAVKELSIQYIQRQNIRGAIESIFRERDEQRSEASISGMEVRQTLLTYKGSLPLRGRCRKLLPVAFAGRQCIATITDDNIVLYDFTRTHKPVAVKSLRVSGVKGVMSWQNDLLAYGNQGMEFCGNRKLQTANACTPVKDVAASRDNLYAVTREGISVYSAKLCKVAAYNLEGAQSILLIGNKIIVGGDDGLSVIEGDNFHHPKKFKDDGNITSLRPAFAFEPGLFVAQLSDGTAKAFAFEDGRPQVVADYSQLPWHTSTVKAGDLLLRISQHDNSVLELFSEGDMELVASEHREAAE